MKKRTIFNLYWVSLPFLIVLGIILSFYITDYSAVVERVNQDNSAFDLCVSNPNISSNSSCDSEQSQVDRDTQTRNNDEIHIFLIGLVYLGFATLYFIGWVGALVNLSRAQQWGWFWGVFLFSIIMLPIYAASGPVPLTPAQVASPRQPYPLGYPPVPPPHPSAGVPSSPMVASSALTILQERFARGEIDAETYKQMRAQLEQ